MNVTMDHVVHAILIGAGATLVIDAWALGRKRLRGIALPDYGLVGRWIAHLARGRFRHDSISASPCVRGERVIGWTAHYLNGLMSPLPLAGEAAPKARVRGRLRSASLGFPSSGACESSSFAPSETDIPWPWLRYNPGRN